MSAFRVPAAFNPRIAITPRSFRWPFLTAGAVEEGTALNLGHGLDGSCLTFMLPPLRPSAEGWPASSETAVVSRE